MKITNQQNLYNTTSTVHSSEHDKYECRLCEETRSIVQPFSENDILCLQEIFLSNGWHRLSVNDIHAGRSIVTTLLYSLKYYHDIACLSLDEMPLDSQFFDVYLYMLQKNYLEGQYYDIEAFLIEHFYADFLWIEETQQLQAESWYSFFLQALTDLKLDKQIPIIFLSYK